MTTTAAGHALLLARTVRHLSLSQVAHRVRLRTQKLVLAHRGELVGPRLQRPVPPEPGWPEAYLPLDARVGEGFPSAEENAEGQFRFLNHDRSLGDPHDWEQAGAEQLWRYHLHYFDWAWAFVAHPDRPWARDAFARLWRSWSGHTTCGRWDAWSPYVVSLRSWAMCAAYRPLVAGGKHEVDFLAQLGLHAGFVRTHLELDVGGNHLIKNLKALAGLGVFLDDDGLVGLATRHLERQITVQVLADGGHFELSPSYHCQVLGDLLDVQELLDAARCPAVEGLAEATASMRRWLGVMLLPDGDVPLFNDCTLVGEGRLTLLEPTPAPHQRLVVLQPSGYAVIRPDDRLHLVADVGPPCPSRLPAHAHADCLSFELAVDGERVLVNSGTSTYHPGPRRAYERSTRAHNTVEVDGQDQTEVWGTFRAARRALPTLERAVDDGRTIEVAASHDGYRRLPGRPVHHRTWRVAAGSVEIVDDVTGAGVHRVASSIHVASPTPVVDVGGGVRLGRLVASAAEADGWRRRPSSPGEIGVATAFGPPRPATTLEAVTEAGLPIRQRLRLAVDPPVDHQADPGPKGALEREGVA